jgi:hypothetical protein
MADEKRDRSKKPDRDNAQGVGDGQRRDTSSGDEPDESDRFEADDVAEDRNVSGASTWLNLPDQPKGGQGTEDDEEPEGGRR